MSNARWQRVQHLYHAALERPASGRAEFLREACASDVALLHEVQSLLDQPISAERFLEAGASGAIDPPSVHIGQHVGIYQVQAFIGRGGMGEVYRARDTTLNRDVALKVLPELFALDLDRLARFKREARVLASLNHPNIAAIYGFEESNNVQALVLELAEGPTLDGGLVPVDTALDYAGQVAEALEAAHSKGIIHRDLKPANVKVTPQGKVKLLDFGLAKAVWGINESQDLSRPLPMDTTRETVAGLIIGSPSYMSPEQARGQDVDERADIWAFGCLLYELLTGRQAFPGKMLADTIAAVLEREPEWKALPDAVPVRVRELLRRCLDKDAARRLRSIAEARRIIEQARRGWNRWRVAAIAAVAIGTLALGGAIWSRGAPPLPNRTEWIQITKFPDSVSQPALSPDGRMVAFIRGPNTFWGAGHVYVKALPDGEPLQLTHDSVAKMSPAFSPDGARIAYTTVDAKFGWDTWIVPAVGGEPRQWLRNASGLVWTGPRDVLYSEMKKSTHMGIVASQESRVGRRDVYFPAHERAMAHRSYMSPNGKWVLLVEMDHDYVWIPCRVVPTDNSSPGRQVGPPGAGCTFGAWSPDGQWMYVTSLAGGAPHIWRQRFPDGEPEQITFGPTAEEGIAMASDGRSFVTAVALQNVSIWLHDANGERQISSIEGTAVTPLFTLDGQRLCYMIASESPTPWVPQPAEVWVADLKSGRSESLAPGFRALSYDISADGQAVVMEVADGGGKPRLWLVPFDRRSAPRQIPNVEGRQPKFGPDGDILFRTAGTVYRVRPDGTAMRKALEQEIHLLKAVSPDGRWLVGSSPLSGNESSVVQAFPLAGGPPVHLGGVGLGWNWSPTGDFLSVSAGPVSANRSYLIPLTPGEALPRVPPGGFQSEEEIAQLPGARKIDALTAVPGASPDVYAFYRGTTQRNLYRIPVQ